MRIWSFLMMPWICGSIVNRKFYSFINIIFLLMFLLLMGFIFLVFVWYLYLMLIKLAQLLHGTILNKQIFVFLIGRALNVDMYMLSMKFSLNLKWLCHYTLYIYPRCVYIYFFQKIGINLIIYQKASMNLSDGISPPQNRGFVKNKWGIVFRQDMAKSYKAIIFSTHMPGKGKWVIYDLKTWALWSKNAFLIPWLLCYRWSTCSLTKTSDDFQKKWMYDTSTKVE